MKKSIAIGILGCVSVSGWAQGFVDFRNNVSFRTRANRYVYFGAVGPGAGTPTIGQSDPNRVVGTAFVAGLWYVKGADQGAQIATAQQVGRTWPFRPATTSEASKGTWIPAAGSTFFRFDDVGIGETATLQVRVWDHKKFSSFEAAVAGGEFGASQPFNYTPPRTDLPADAYYMDNLRAFAVIPEPSTIALGILSAAGLLFLRRRSCGEMQRIALGRMKLLSCPKRLGFFEWRFRSSRTLVRTKLSRSGELLSGNETPLTSSAWRSFISTRRWKHVYLPMTMLRPNKPDAVNPAIASRFYSEDHWRGVGEPGR